MRFSLETLFGFTTVCAFDAALLASGSTAGVFVGVLLAASLTYVTIVWVLNHARLSQRKRGALVAISGGLVAGIVVMLLASWNR